MDRAQKYAMWLGTLAMSLFYPLLALITTCLDQTHRLNAHYTGHFAMLISLAILGFFALFGPITADPNRKTLPKWAWMTLIYSCVGLFATFPLVIFSDRNSAMSFVYIPGAIFSLNMLVTLLIQTWMASEKMGLSFWKTLPVHILFLVWVGVVTHVPNAKLIVTSVVVFMATLLITLPIVFIAERRMQAMAEQKLGA